MSSSGISLSARDNQQQRPQNNGSFYHQQILSGANINVLTIKSPSSGSTTTSITPALYIERGSSVENLPPPVNNSVSQSITASRSNIGCGKAVSFSRSVSQGAYIIPNSTTILSENRISSRAPLATLQHSNLNHTMSQTKRILQANYASMQAENLSDTSYMEQDENSQPQSAQALELFSNISKQSNSVPIRTSLSSHVISSEGNPPAAKRLKLRDSWSRYLFTFIYTLV